MKHIPAQTEASRPLLPFIRATKKSPRTNSSLAEAAHARTRGEYLQRPLAKSELSLHRTSANWAQKKV